jgi:Arc/MetJ family transcription regulator
VRTNIDIDDELMAHAMRITKLPTKKAVVEEALRHLILSKQELAIRELWGLWADDPEACARAADEGEDDQDRNDER